MELRRDSLDSEELILAHYMIKTKNLSSSSSISSNDSPLWIVLISFPPTPSYYAPDSCCDSLLRRVRPPWCPRPLLPAWGQRQDFLGHHRTHRRYWHSICGDQVPRYVFSLASTCVFSRISRAILRYLPDLCFSPVLCSPVVVTMRIDPKIGKAGQLSAFCFYPDVLAGGGLLPLLLLSLLVWLPMATFILFNGLFGYIHYFDRG